MRDELDTFERGLGKSKDEPSIRAPDRKPAKFELDPPYLLETQMTRSKNDDSSSNNRHETKQLLAWGVLVVAAVAISFAYLALSNTPITPESFGVVFLYVASLIVIIGNTIAGLAPHAIGFVDDFLLGPDKAQHEKRKTNIFRAFILVVILAVSIQLSSFQKSLSVQKTELQGWLQKPDEVELLFSEESFWRELIRLRDDSSARSIKTTYLRSTSPLNMATINKGANGIFTAEFKHSGDPIVAGLKNKWYTEIGDWISANPESRSFTRLIAKPDEKAQPDASKELSQFFEVLQSWEKTGGDKDKVDSKYNNIQIRWDTSLPSIGVTIFDDKVAVLSFYDPDASNWVYGVKISDVKVVEQLSNQYFDKLMKLRD